MLSGIGDSSVLSQFGIDTIVDLPDVGQNLQVWFSVKSSITSSPAVYDVCSPLTDSMIVRTTYFLP